jgi:lauroyl/myristoyl acyltransferase
VPTTASGAGERVAAALRDLRADPGEVRGAIGRLDFAGLRRYGVDACHLNLLSLLGATRAVDQVARTAEECARTRLWRGWHFYASETAGAREPRPVLAGWDAELLHRARARGRGLLVCGFHFGSYRFIPTDLGRLGFPVTFAVDTRTYENESWGGGPPPGAGLELARIDDPAGLVTLVRAVRRGGVAYLNVDGNRGWGTGTAEPSHCTVRFLGLQLRVMTGAARIAAANGAVLLPVAAVPDGAEPGRVVCGEPIAPPEPGTDTAEFTARAMQTLYDFFAGHVAAAPAEWQDLRFLHRWRVPEAPAAPRDGAARDRLAAGAAFCLDGSRLVRVGGDGVWMDVRTMVTLRPPEWAMELFHALASPGGVDSRWLAARYPDAERRGAAIDLLSTLGSRGAVVEQAEFQERQRRLKDQ